MCMGGGDAPSYTPPPAPKVAPAPTQVQSADVEAEKATGKKKERPRASMSANNLSSDRTTILGSMLENTGRDKLG